MLVDAVHAYAFFRAESCKCEFGLPSTLNDPIRQFSYATFHIYTG